MHVPTVETRASVLAYARVGVPHEMIKKIVGISSVNTLKKYYQDELDLGEAHGIAAVAGTLYARATEGNDLGAAIFYLKARAGWSERQKVEISGPDGGPVEVSTLEAARLRLARRLAGSKDKPAEE